MNDNVRPRMATFRALGDNNPPDEVEIGGRAYCRVEVYKHDSWAATALYEQNAHEASKPPVVCKFNRTSSMLGVPFFWVGRFLAHRETFAYQRLSHIPGICESRAPVCVSGHALPNAAAHDYVEGHPLRSREAVSDHFFPRLQQMLREIHEAGFAYVDLHKRENVLVGEDGLPYLVDFQICFYCSPWQRRFNPLARGILYLLQHADLYHFAKHVRRLRPDQLESLGLAHHRRRPFYIRAHRAIAVPFRGFRRRLLTNLKIRDRSGRSSSELFAEHAFRVEKEQSPEDSRNQAA